MKIKGALVPALTFFDKDGNIDENYQLKHMDWVLANGVNGLFVTGTYGSGGYSYGYSTYGTSSTGSVRTGDDTNTMMFVYEGLAGVALFAVAAALIRRRRRSRK